MATQGPSSGGTTTSTAGLPSGATLGWVNTGNSGADDAAYATADATFSIDDITEYLKITNFGFSIPAGATINSITAGVKRKTNTSSLPVDYSIKIVKAGTISGTDQSAGDAWPTSEATKTFTGGGGALWGLAWGPSDINDSGFGVAISCADSGSVGGWIASINYITLTIDYTPAASSAHTLTLLGVGT
jgi:hypothetical protein